jgi:hypothetical protein
VCLSLGLMYKNNLIGEYFCRTDNKIKVHILVYNSFTFSKVSRTVIIARSEMPLHFLMLTARKLVNVVANHSKDGSVIRGKLFKNIVRRA